jgi:sugar phosphate isomerase/epimerase
MSSLPSISKPLRLGCCGSMISAATDPLGAAIADQLAALGFDYLELSLRDLVALSGSAQADLAGRLRRAGIGCEACNNFFPPEIRLTGPAVDLPAALRYAERALAAAARLGASIVVFGSSGARNVPPGFSAEAAWIQLRTLLASLGAAADRHGLTIAIEHLNRGESNIINTVAEGWRMVREVGHPRVRLLADAYHLLQENESPSILAKVAGDLVHVHVAQGAERVFPAGDDAALRDFFAQLRATGYAGRCSIEAFTRDFSLDASRALRVCRDLATG